MCDIPQNGCEGDYYILVRWRSPSGTRRFLCSLYPTSLPAYTVKQHLAFGWRAGNLNWPIRIQQAGKNLVSWRQVNKSGKASKSGNFSHWKWLLISTKRDLHFQKHYQFTKSEKYEPFCVSKLLFWRQKWVAIARHGNSLVVRRVSPGRIIVVLFWTKYDVPRQIKPEIFKLTTSRDQSNLRTVFIFV